MGKPREPRTREQKCLDEIL